MSRIENQIYIEKRIDFFCSQCGQPVSVREDRGGDVQVVPCKDCIKDSYENGLKDGKSKD